MLTDSERDYSYYNVSLGYNVFPGEGFVGRRRALNTATYVIGGVGKTSFAGDDRFTVNFGVGMRMLVGYEYGRGFERALSEHRPRGG